MDKLIEALVVTAEVIGTELSRAAAKVMLSDLAQYPEPMVLDALARCRREVRGKLTLSDVIARLDDGRPTADEAWAMWPRDEAATAVLTSETFEAMQHAQTLLREDRVAARMAFKDAYTKAVQRQRDARAPVHWMPSLGYDAASRAPVLIEAARLGRITVEHALAAIPSEARDQAVAALAPDRALPQNADGQRRVRALVAP